ncbi:MAG: DUF6270 domain-containing protein [Marmoricola sp.]
MSSPSVVAVAGSCLTRDNFNSRFNPDYKRFFSCDLTANQMAMIALMSPPFDEVTDVGAPPGMPAYGLWNVRTELDRSFLQDVVATQPDYLILDFYGDVHFGVVQLDDGRYLTRNRWKLMKTGFWRHLDEGGRIRRRLDIFEDPDGYFAVWREALDRFAGHLAEHCPDTHVIVHRGWNTDEVAAPGHPLPIPLTRFKKIRRFDVPRGNELWARLDDYCIATYGWDVIDLRPLRVPSTADHPWKAGRVHYAPDYYHRFLAELHKIHLRRTGTDADLLARIDAIEQAAAEPVTRERDAYREAYDEQRRRARELDARLKRREASSPVLAARRWAGRVRRRITTTGGRG